MRKRWLCATACCVVMLLAGCTGGKNGVILNESSNTETVDSTDRSDNDLETTSFLNTEPSNIQNSTESVSTTQATENSAETVTHNKTNYQKKLIWPVPEVDTITGDYREDSILAHQYISIGGEGAYGMAVVAAMDGIVSKVVSADERLGTYIEITHTDGLSTIYATLGSTAVSVSQPVNAGMVIGKVGMSGNATGPSHHFEVRCNGSPVNPHLYLEES